MSKIINDSIFGEMEYKHSWTKKSSLLWGKEYTVNITVQAYKGDDILDSQRNMYKYFKSTINEVLNKAIPKIITYCEEILGQKNLQPEDIFSALIPRTVIFERDGSWGVLFDTEWDIENGIAFFVINNEIQVGTQEYFL